MKKRRPWRNRTLAFWLSIESVVVTLVTVAPFAMLHILDRFHWLWASTVSVLGILAVMGWWWGSPPRCSAANSTEWCPA